MTSVTHSPVIFETKSESAGNFFLSLMESMSDFVTIVITGTLASLTNVSMIPSSSHFSREPSMTLSMTSVSESACFVTQLMD